MTDGAPQLPEPVEPTEPEPMTPAQSTGTDYRHFSHQQLADMVKGIQPGQVGELAASWNNLGQTLVGFADLLKRTVDSGREAWQGQAGDAAHGNMMSLSDRVHGLGMHMETMSVRVGQQSAIAGNAKYSMPLPVDFSVKDAALMMASEPNPLKWPETVSKIQQKFEEQQRAHDEAARVVDAYAKGLIETTRPDPPPRRPPIKWPPDEGIKWPPRERPQPVEGGPVPVGGGGGSGGGDGGGGVPPGPPPVLPVPPGPPGGPIPPIAPPGPPWQPVPPSPPGPPIGGPIPGPPIDNSPIGTTTAGWSPGDAGSSGDGSAGYGSGVGGSGIGADSGRTVGGHGSGGSVGYLPGGAGGPAAGARGAARGPGGPAGLAGPGVAGAGRGKGGEDSEHKTPSYLVETDEGIWTDGMPPTMPPVIGE